MNIDPRSEASILIQKYASKGALIDTNLLLLLFAGFHTPSLIQHPKLRTNKYSEEDHGLLQKVIDPFHQIIITPQILAEISNLSSHLEDRYLQSYYLNIITFLGNVQIKEEHVSKNLLIKSNLLSRLGFTDISIIENAKCNKYLVITDDLPLYMSISAAQCECLYFTYLRNFL